MMILINTSLVVQEVMSPNMYNAKLWKTSGHWDHYAENMFRYNFIRFRWFCYCCIKAIYKGFFNTLYFLDHLENYNFMAKLIRALQVIQKDVKCLCVNGMCFLYCKVQKKFKFSFYFCSFFSGSYQRTGKCQFRILHTVCPGSSDPFYIVTYYLKWVTTTWTHSMIKTDLDSNIYFGNSHKIN